MTSRITGLAVAISLGLHPSIHASPPGGNARAEQSSRKPPTECTRFESPERLPAGTPFRAPLTRGLEFRLSATWEISIGPAGEPSMDYLWVVSPPLRTAPHRMIGAGYGLSARESAQIHRPLRFVLTRAQYDQARAAIELDSADETLKRLDALGVGRLSLAITDFDVRGVKRPDGTPADEFVWIRFQGEACMPTPPAG